MTVDQLVRWAQAYLARHAASRRQLERVLGRKVARRRAQGLTDPADDATPLIPEAVERIVRAGWIDEGSLAEARARSLVRKGLPAGRILRQLAHQGLDPASVPDILASSDDETQASRYAERKRLGRFASGLRAPSFERDLRAMVRAGFDVRTAERVLRGEV